MSANTFFGDGFFGAMGGGGGVSASPDLITLDRAKYNLNNLATTSAQDTTLASLITGVSQAIQKFCRRKFVAAQYDELYRGTYDDKMVLKQFPIISVDRLAYNPMTVLRVINQSQANQRASVAITRSGVTLVRVSAGVVTTDTSVTFVANVTLQAVADAINALGNGWNALAIGNFAPRASTDLRAPQGALNAYNTAAEIKLHVDELYGFEIDVSRGLLLRTNYYFVDGTFDPAQATWYGGVNWWRIVYTAGFATVPLDVQEACAEWVAQLFFQTQRDPAVTSEVIGGSSSHQLVQQMPTTIRQLLLPYRAHTVGPLGI